MSKLLRLGYPLTMGTGSKRGYPFDSIFKQSQQVTGYDIRRGDVDALIIWGGEDVSPSLYKHRTSKRTFADSRPGRRDMVELEVFNAATEMGLPIIGVCRGAQFACALSGGSLIQHVSNHAGRDHGVTFTDRTVKVPSGDSQLFVTSCHHQMMYPFEVEHKMLGVSSEKMSTTYIGQDDKEIEFMHRDSTPEPEFVYFPQTNCLAIQGHPEFVSDLNDEFIQVSLDLTRKLLDKAL